MTTLGCLSSPMLSKLCDTAARPMRTRTVGPAQRQRCDGIGTGDLEPILIIQQL